MKLKEGRKVSGKIWDTVIKEGRLHKENGRWYFCQNEKNGACGSKRYGYKYSWVFNENSDGTYGEGVSDLKPLAPNIEDVYVGAIIENEYGKRRVLGICGEVVFISVKGNPNTYWGGYTVDDLKCYGYKLVPEDPTDEVEITVDGKTKVISRKSAEAMGLVDK